MTKKRNLFALSLLLAGCGSSSDLLVGTPVPQPAIESVSASIISAQGGSIAHPTTGHTATLAPQALGNDGTVSLTLLSSDGIVPRDEAEFDPVGTALRLDTPSAVRGKLTFSIPYQTISPNQHRLYWQLSNGMLFPLRTQYGNGTFTGTLDLTQANFLAQAAGQPLSQTLGNSFTVVVVDESKFFGRPDHVPWPSYNLYQFQNNTWTRIVNQGVPVNGAAPPSPGNSPLMFVHGLGSNIPRFQDAAAFMASNGNYSRIYGFEYDTLSGLQTSGPKLDQAYSSLENDSTRHWSHVAHSMGTLVSRVAFEGGIAAPYASNSVAFAAGPHTGSLFVNALQGDLDIFQEVVSFLVLNEVMDFTNADGTPCKVSITDAGFNDLASGNATLAALNTDAASHHPKETYRTVGGNDPGLEFDFADFTAGIYPDDGLVFLYSANPGSLIGAVKSDVVPESHTSIMNSAESLRVILTDLQTGN